MNIVRVRVLGLLLLDELPVLVGFEVVGECNLAVLDIAVLVTQGDRKPPQILGGAAEEDIEGHEKRGADGENCRDLDMSWPGNRAPTKTSSHRRSSRTGISLADRPRRRRKRRQFAFERGVWLPARGDTQGGWPQVW